jgi:UDP-N-acetylglucosamine--N-acetylmuramyl-(pentapeptide) pyrophosphoryl-undecaprenol N-acetylglucosamine transferase
LHLLPISGWRGKSALSLLVAPFKLLRSVWQARAVIKQARANVVLGMGGFASGPGGVAARIAGVPLVIHEQNAIAGMTNRWLSKFAARKMAAFPNALAEAEVVGNPVRADLLALPVKDTNRDKPLRLLIIGGSRGARALNETVAPAIALLPENERPEIWHQVGKGQHRDTEQIYRRAELDVGSEQINVVEFIDDMRAAYEWADLVLCRAGALTVSEIAAVGLPAIFVPFPHAVDDHQTHNAAYLTSREAAWLLPQKEFTAEKLRDVLHNAHRHREQLHAMALRAKTLAITDSADHVAQVCQQVAL